MPNIYCCFAMHCGFIDHGCQIDFIPVSLCLLSSQLITFCSHISVFEQVIILWDNRCYSAFSCHSTSYVISCAPRDYIYLLKYIHMSTFTNDCHSCHHELVIDWLLFNDRTRRCIVTLILQCYSSSNISPRFGLWLLLFDTLNLHIICIFSPSLGLIYRSGLGLWHLFVLN